MKAILLLLLTLFGFSACKKERGGPMGHFKWVKTGVYPWHIGDGFPTTNPRWILPKDANMSVELKLIRSPNDAFVLLKNDQVIIRCNDYDYAPVLNTLDMFGDCATTTYTPECDFPPFVFQIREEANGLHTSNDFPYSVYDFGHDSVAINYWSLESY